jgi:hypothetical protein
MFCPVPKLENHPLSAEKHHVVMTRDTLNMKLKQSRNENKTIRSGQQHSLLPCKIFLSRARLGRADHAVTHVTHVTTAA